MERPQLGDLQRSIDDSRSGLANATFGEADRSGPRGMPLIIQLASGAVGGNGAGSLMKKSSLGTLGNSIAGIVGDGLGGQLLGMLGVATGRGAWILAAPSGVSPVVVWAVAS